VAEGKSGALKVCSADGGDYPQLWRASEINSDYALDSQSPHYDEARHDTPGIRRTRKVRLIA
jgi:hypothetical protein